MRKKADKPEKSDKDKKETKSTTSSKKEVVRKVGSTTKSKKVGRKKKKVVDKPPKIRQTVEKLEIGLDDDVDQSVKRRKKKSEKAVDTPVQPVIEYNFKDSIDVVGGDCRNHFNHTRDPGHEDSVWCLKNGHCLHPKICGMYVTPKCKKKLRCKHYEYGMEIKLRYRLNTRSDVDREESKKKKYNGECEVDGESENNE
jgi:hypothetical protein